MKSSLLVLSGADGRRCAVLGDMGELGKDEIALHEDVGAYAASCVDHLIAVGPMSRAMYEAALRENPGLSASWYESVEEFLSHVEQEVRKGDTVLVKASHYMQFQRIVEALT
jgi:UDP-N-acetylmuramoyl-tripeptide--D-alanyl-D-alanine ligase